MIDERNRRLAQVTKADDFVVGGKLISLLYTQLAENRHLAAVFAQLFDAEGSEIHLKPAERYVESGRSLTRRSPLRWGVSAATPRISGARPRPRPDHPRWGSPPGAPPPHRQQGPDRLRHFRLRSPAHGRLPRLHHQQARHERVLEALRLEMFDHGVDVLAAIPGRDSAPKGVRLEWISPRPILFVVGEHAHSRYELGADPKELHVVPNAGHVDVYDKTA